MPGPPLPVLFDVELVVDDDVVVVVDVVDVVDVVVEDVEVVEVTVTLVEPLPPVPSAPPEPRSSSDAVAQAESRSTVDQSTERRTMGASEASCGETA
jgi:hypothetical protein